MLDFKRAVEGDLASKVQRQKASFSGRVTEGFSKLNNAKDGLGQASGPLLSRVEMVGNRTGVKKITQKDVKFIGETLKSMQIEGKELLRLSLWEDKLFSEGARPPWPKPAYSGKALHISKHKLNRTRNGFGYSMAASRCLFTY